MIQYIARNDVDDKLAGTLDAKVFRNELPQIY